jgi:hypothetical protein
MSWPEWIAPAFSLLGGLAGGLFGTYVSKRGEIRAVHKELGKVIKQNEAITEATEKIKVQTATSAWARDVRKEAAFEALKSLATVDGKLTNLVAHLGPNAQAGAPLIEAESAFQGAYQDYVRAIIIPSVVCGREIANGFISIQNLFMTIVDAGMKGNIDQMLQGMQALVLQTTVVGELVRRDLGIEL